MNRSFSARAALVACAPLLYMSTPTLSAAEGVIEEITVTARQREETLQDVPVTVAALTEEDLQRYAIDDLVEAAKLVPNLQIFQGGSGNGSNLYLRGIGSSSISAAFDQSVALNIDGVVINVGRFIYNAYMDMGQIEVLKGPQSLYFGKSATAGVISIRSKDPGEEFEFQLSASNEFEHDEIGTEMVISGPLTDTFGARFAIGYREADELFENLAANVTEVANPDRGEEALNSRLTLLWEPLANFSARFKYSYSEYENDGPNGLTEEFCPEGTVQPSAVPAGSFALALFPGVDDCDLNANTSLFDLNENLRAGLPYGADDGIPFRDMETDFFALELDWGLTPSLDVTSVTGYVDMKHIALGIYDYNAGVFGGLHRNDYESFSQELRIASAFDGPLNFQAGLYYQDIEQVFEAYEYAFNLGVIVGPDPVTGNEYDYNKNHFTDSEVWSGFLAGYWDITDRLELTAGARYTDEQKDGSITIPYLHAAAGAFGFGAPPLIEGLEFDDENFSPEVAVNYYLTDEVSVYAAYKEGFKSGGIDNSALPTAALNPATNPNFPNFLLFDSEEASGWETGIKAVLAGGSLRINGTVFDYNYDDLQVQLFDANIIQFRTFNASRLGTTGVEAELNWLTPINGLSIRSSMAITDTKYEDEFINATGEDLDGEDRVLSADFAGYVGATYDWPVASMWRMSASLDVRYNSGYPISATLNPYEQDDFWLTDAALRLYSTNERWELSLIGRNLGDEIYARSSGSRPGACFMADPSQVGVDPTAVCQSTIANNQDQTTNTSFGRQVVARLRYRL